MDFKQLFTLLGEPNLIIKKVTKDEILNDKQLISYNPIEAKKTIILYEDSNPTFYRKENTLYILYSVEGFKIFKKLSLFSSCLNNFGFREANIIDCEDGTGLVYINGFGEDKKGYAENSKENRKKFALKQMTVTQL